MTVKWGNTDFCPDISTNHLASAASLAIYSVVLLCRKPDGMFSGRRAPHGSRLSAYWWSWEWEGQEEKRDQFTLC